jgi:hypothetical protein
MISTEDTINDKQKYLNDLTNEEKDDFKKKMMAEVKVKFVSEEIIVFNPFRICASFPAKYHIINIITNKMEFRDVYQIQADIKNNGIETNNIQYLLDSKFDVKNLTLNLEL